LPLELFDYVNWLWKTCSRSNSPGLQICPRRRRRRWPDFVEMGGGRGACRRPSVDAAIKAGS